MVAHICDDTYVQGKEEKGGLHVVAHACEGMGRGMTLICGGTNAWRNVGESKPARGDIFLNFCINKPPVHLQVLSKTGNITMRKNDHNKTRTFFLFFFFEWLKR